MHPPSLLATIVVSLVAAYVCGVAARAVRLPPLVGYLAAGVAVGPFTPGMMADPGMSAELAEIGVALLLFGVGLHFSLADLLAVWSVALPGALLQIAASTGIGFALARFAMGWPVGSALVLGLAVAIASTAVAIRMLEDRGAVSAQSGRIALGWLVIQDVTVVLVLVLLPAATALEARGAAALPDLLGRTALELAGFVATVMLVGRWLIPLVLAKTARAGSRELFTLAVMVMALGIAWGSAQLFGVSLALGAFFAGVVLAESDLSHQAAAESLPIQHVFTALFFVSVGMLFDPRIVLQAPLQVLAVVAAIIVGTGGVTLALLLAFRTEPRAAVTVAAAIAQIGEFSFILSGLAMTDGYLPAEGRDLVLAAALVAIVANPFLARAVEPLATVLERLPALRRWRTRGGEASLPRGAAPPALRDHAVVIGHGRVGRVVAAALSRHGLPFVVVEYDRRVVERLRREGVDAIYGDATRLEVLQAARPAAARLLVVAVPDRFMARRIIELARNLNPEIDTVVRTHTDDEASWLEEREIGLVVMGERETALGIAAYALRTFGAEGTAARATLDELRAATAA